MYTQIREEKARKRQEGRQEGRRDATTPLPTWLLARKFGTDVAAELLGILEESGERTLMRVPTKWLRVAAALSAVAVAACDSLTLRREPETARIEIESADVDQANLITADWFVFVDDPDCPACEATVRLVNGDTSVVALPFEQTYRFGRRLQFFAETYPVTGEPAVLSLRAYVDGSEWINSSRLLRPVDDNGRPETLRFVYQYSVARLP